MPITQSKHAPTLPVTVSQQLTESNIARPMSEQEQLRMALEQLQLVQEELHHKNQLLEIVHQTLKQERKRLRAAHQKIRKQATELNTDFNAASYKQPDAHLSHAQRLESLGILVSRIVHDLNNILSPIVTVSQLLRSHNPNLSEQSQEMLKILENSAKRGATLTKQILTYSRESHGEHKLTQIVPLLQESLDTAQVAFQKSIRVDRHLPEQPLWSVATDPTQIYQVLMNLYVNARDAMSDGGVLTVSAENCFVNQAFTSRHPDARVGNYVVITVTDTGTGIAPEVRDRIFEPFFTTKPVGQGTGLGLATVLAIVKAHGGFLHILSKVGQGTSVKVYLPALAEPECSDWICQHNVDN
jgi:two-component system, cell cycle sensor histidine kinase and response regulator CckA